MILCGNPAAQFRSYQSEIEEAILNVVRGNRYILGDEVKLLEKEFSEYIGSVSSVGVASGTDAIELSLRALKIGYGDEVITVSHTAVATVAAIEAVGATPVLVDVDPQFYTLNSKQLKEVVTTRTKAVVAVHLYGQAADLDSILNFCYEKKLYLIEDASQTHGAKYKGLRVGAFGDVSCFSCYPTKNLGAIGDAGLITTNNYDLAVKINGLREYGWNNGISEYPGVNSRLDELQAAVLRVKLKYLDSDNAKRHKLAEYYTEELSNLPIQVPTIRKGSESVFHLYVIQVENRQGLLKHLKEKGIQAGIHYPMPVHLQPAYKGRIKTATNMSVTENVSQRIVSIPIYPELKMSEAKKVVESIANFYIN
jgi:dTDP-4-amino-4,6-dideoxygalactose transaminase